MPIETNLTADHPMVRLMLKLNDTISAERVAHGDALNALLNLYVQQVLLHPCCWAPCLEGLDHVREMVLNKAKTEGYSAEQLQHASNFH